MKSWAFFDLYGFYSDNMDYWAPILADNLNIKWTAHENSFTGGYYRYYNREMFEVFELRVNCFEKDKYFEPKFTQYKSLLYIGPTQRPVEFEHKLLPKFKDVMFLLKRERIYGA